MERGRENPFKGWLLVFLIYNLLLTLPYVAEGVQLIRMFSGSNTEWYYYAINACAALLLPLSLLLLTWSRPSFRVVYLLHIVSVIACSLITTGEPSLLAAALAAAVELPWLVYLYCSQRVKNLIKQDKNKKRELI